MNTIAIFHIGRGGEFNNPGHTSFIRFEENGSFDPDYFGEDYYFADENGNLVDDIDDAVNVVTASGHIACDIETFQSDEGRFEIDGNYDTYYWKPISELTEEEKELIPEFDRKMYDID